MNNDALNISAAEKRIFRHHKIKLGSIHLLGILEIQELLNTSKFRAMELSALSEFQSLPSVGPRFAHDLISMGYYSLKELRGKDAAKLLDKYERQVGVWTDPCVEDQFRMVVHFANHPGVHKNWWEFTPERKAFRLKNGYPKNRPVKPWYMLEQYQRSSNVKATNQNTKKDLAKRLKDSIDYMNEHFSEKIALKDLAEAATVSIYHYQRQFRNVYELTPIQYLTNIRLKNASRLLKTNNMSIADIGQRCGFQNESAFIRLFKSHLAKTPLQLRKTFGK